VNSSTEKHLSGSGISLSDCGIVLNRNTWFKHNNDQQAQTVISNRPQKLESLLNKLLLYNRNYGTKKTALRVMYGIKIAVYKAARKKVL